MNINTTLNLINRTIEIKALQLLVTDDSLSKTVYCKCIVVDKNNRPMQLRRPLLLWSQTEYDSVGDWTQSQAEARVLELLGNNIKESLEKLI